MKRTDLLRRRARELRASGRRSCDIAMILNVSSTTISNWTGDITAPSSRFGKCWQCKRKDQPLERYRKKDLCRDCLNPPVADDATNYAHTPSGAADAQQHAEEKPIGLTKAERRGLGT